MESKPAKIIRFRKRKCRVKTLLKSTAQGMGKVIVAAITSSGPEPCYEQAVINAEPLTNSIWASLC